MQYEELTIEELTSENLFIELLNIKDHFAHINAVTKCKNRAKELKIQRDFENNFKAYKTAEALKKSLISGRKTDFIDQPIQLNCGEWICDGFGVKINKVNKQNGEFYSEWASPIPILPSALLENADDGIEKLRISFFKDTWRSIICDRSRVANATKIIDLADRGIEVNSNNSKLLVKYISDLVSFNLSELPRYKSISRLGWVGNEFMPYDTEIVFDGESENKPLFDAINQKGSYERWVECVQPLRDNIYLRLQMAASFASPIIEKIGGLPFVLHLWGGTGTGKTVGLMVAMSIWGNPAMGKLLRTMNVTNNAMMSTAAFLCNLPFAGDELQLIKSNFSNYDTMIMRVTEGINRGRMNYNKNEELKVWKCAFLFTGEEPITKSNSGGGTKNRVIEIECSGKIVDNGNKVVKSITANYGHAGMKFIEYIRQQNNLNERFKGIFDIIITLGNTEEKQAMSMAVMILADELAGECIFKEQKRLEFDDVKDFMVSVDEIDNSERAFEFVTSLISENIHKFVGSKTYTASSGTWGKIDTPYTFFDKQILSEEMSKKGLSFDACKRKWAEKGYLIRYNKQFTRKESYNGIQNHCVRLKTF